MLILSRQPQDSFRIILDKATLADLASRVTDDNPEIITIKYLNRDFNKRAVRLGIAADRRIKILREEICNTDNDIPQIETSVEATYAPASSASSSVETVG